MNSQIRKTATASSRTSRRNLRIFGLLTPEGAPAPRLSPNALAKQVYIAGVRLAKVDLSGHIFARVFDLLAWPGFFRARRSSIS